MGFETKCRSLPCRFRWSRTALPMCWRCLAASAALTISDIPFNGPIGAVRVCRVEGEFVVNPSLEQIAASDFEMVLAGTSDKAMTIELEAKEVSEDVVVAAMDVAYPVDTAI